MAAITPTTLALASGLVVVLAFLLRPLTTWVRKIPGPFIAKYTRLWYAWQIYRGDFHWTFIKLHRAKGKIVQVMPNYFSIDDPDAHKTIYGHASAWLKGEFYQAFSIGDSPDQNNLFALRDPALHGQMRRKVASMFSMSTLVNYEAYVDECLDLFQARMREFAAEGTAIDMGLWVQFFAFDVVSLLTFGERLGFLNEGEDIENMIGDSHVDHLMLSLVSVWPWFTSPLRKLAELANGAGLLKFMGYIERRIETMRRELADEGPSSGPGGPAAAAAAAGGAPVSMMQALIEAQRDEKKGVTDWDILANMAANIAAGSDTTAIGVSATVFHLYSNPACLGRLRREIEDAGLPDRPRFQDVQRLPYLQAAIKEGLRLAPGFGLPLWREVPKGGAVVAGQFFPEGANVGVNSWVPCHSREVYGPDVDSFRPERWLEASAAAAGAGAGDEAASAMERAWFPFGGGSRACIGKNLALLEMSRVIPVLVRNFDLVVLGKDGRPSRGGGDLHVHNNWFTTIPDFHARLVDRRGA